MASAVLVSGCGGGVVPAHIPDIAFEDLSRNYDNLVSSIDADQVVSQPPSGDVTYVGVLALRHDTPSQILGRGVLRADFSDGLVSLTADGFVMSAGGPIGGTLHGDGELGAGAADPWSMSIAGHLQMPDATAEVMADLIFFLRGTDGSFVEAYGPMSLSGDEGDASFVAQRTD